MRWHFSLLSHTTGVETGTSRSVNHENWFGALASTIREAADRRRARGARPRIGVRPSQEAVHQKAGRSPGARAEVLTGHGATAGRPYATLGRKARYIPICFMQIVPKIIKIMRLSFVPNSAISIVYFYLSICSLSWTSHDVGMAMKQKAEAGDSHCDRYVGDSLMRESPVHSLNCRKPVQTQPPESVLW